MMLPAAEIANNVPDAVRVFGDGPKTCPDDFSRGFDGLFDDWLTLVKNNDRTSEELISSSVEQAAN